MVCDWIFKQHICLLFLCIFRRRSDRLKILFSNNRYFVWNLLPLSFLSRGKLLQKLCTRFFDFLCAFLIFVNFWFSLCFLIFFVIFWFICAYLIFCEFLIFFMIFWFFSWFFAFFCVFFGIILKILLRYFSYNNFKIKIVLIKKIALFYNK